LRYGTKQKNLAGLLGLGNKTEEKQKGKIKGRKRKTKEK